MTVPVEVVIVGRDETGGAFSSAGGGLAKIGQIAMGILTSQVFTKLAEGVKNFATSIIEEGREAALVNADLAATLASMGDVSGQTMESISAMADAMSLNSTFTDEQIKQSSILMLTFDKIGQETFPRAQQMAVDLAARFKMDLSSATTALSKALQGTTGSLSALSKQGVTFTDEQKKVIEALFESGRAAEAQAMIMDAIAPQVEGAAASQVTAWEKVQKRFDMMKESLGTALLPAIDKLGESLGAALDNPAVQEALQKLVTWLAENAPLAIDKLLGFIDRLGGMFGQAKSDVMGFITPFIPAIKSIMVTFDKMRPSIEATAKVLGEKLVAAGKELYEKVFPFLVQTLAKFALWFAENRPLIEAFIAKMSERFAALADAVVGFWNVIQPILSGLFDLILGLVELIMEVATGDWEAAWETIQEIVVNVFDSLSTAAVNFLDWIAGLMGGSLQQIKTTWQGNWNLLKSITSQVMAIISSTISNVLNSIRSAFSSAWSNIISGVSGFASSLYNSVYSAVNNAYNAVVGTFSKFYSAGTQIIQQIINGIQSKASQFFEYIGDMVTNAINTALGFATGTTGGTTGGGGGCFIAGTMVLMSDGSIKRIEEIEVGDFVLSYDIKDEIYIPNRVIQTLHHLDKPNPYYLVINGYLGVTPNHLMYINGLWNEAETLSIGDILLGIKYSEIVVYSIDIINNAVPVYNLETENDAHNYFAGGILVHNAKKATGTAGWETVPPGHPHDSYPVWLTSGESFAVTSAARTPAMGGAGRTVNNYFNATINNYSGTKTQAQSVRGLT